MIRLRLWPIFALATLVLATGMAFGASATDVIFPPIVYENGSFIAPNEISPIEMKPLLKEAPEGIELAVGADRGWIAAGLEPKIKGIVFVDHDRQIVFFNQMNAALLEAASSRKHYVKLRLKASQEEWAEVAKAPGLSETARRLLGDIGAWRWWKFMVRENVGTEMRQFHEQSEKRRFQSLPLHGSEMTVPFHNANYLWDDTQFDRVSALAKNHQVSFYEAGLGYPTELRKIIHDLQSAGKKISVMNISNAWWDYYIPRKRLRRSLNAFRPVLDPNGILLLTTHPEIARNWGDWYYFGHRFKSIFKDGTDSKDFVQSVLPSTNRVPARYDRSLDGIQLASDPADTAPACSIRDRLKKLISLGRGK